MIVTQDNYKEQLIGAKAEKLFFMLEKGFPVPPLICVSGDLPQNADTLLPDCRPDTLWAVRSCSLCEDGSRHSFAGQHETLLSVPTNALSEAVRRCLNVDGSREYRKAMGIADSAESFVIIQKMINADVSGVIFSANPLGILSEAVITAGFGVGAAVDEKKPVSTYCIAESGHRCVSLQKDAPQLDDDRLDALMSVCHHLKELFGGHIDIEYAFEGKKLYILQCRPITTLPAEPQTILDNSNISESYPGISLPLTISFVRDAYTGVFSGVAMRCLKSRRLVGKYSELLRNMTGSVNGRIYYKISSWYTVIHFLPFSKKIIPVWQEMMGVSEKSVSGAKPKLSPLRRMLSYFNVAYEFLRVPSGMKRLEKKFGAISRHYEESFTPQATPAELIWLYDKIADEVLSCWDITLLNDMYAFIFTGLLKKRVGNDEANRLISGISDIESMKPVRAFAQLASRAAADGLHDELSAIKTDKDALEYLSRKNDFCEALREYIRLYGDRAPHELKLETATYRSSPLLAVQQLAQCCEGETLDRLRAVADSNAANDGRREKKGFFAKRASLGIRNREISRLNRSRIYGMIRGIFLAVGESFAQSGIITAPDDIFMLTVDEIKAACTDEKASCAGLVTERRRLLTFYEGLPAYPRIAFAAEEFSKAPDSGVFQPQSTGKDAKLRGTPCSRGIARGRALVIDDAPDKDCPAGCILVAKMTDPGWVFIMAKSKGIISEKGSLLSHTAIISRELGIPAVTGAENAASVIKTGDIVTLDGSTGEIYVERDNI